MQGSNGWKEKVGFSKKNTDDVDESIDAGFKTKKSANVWLNANSSANPFKHRFASGEEEEMKQVPKSFSW